MSIEETVLALPGFYNIRMVEQDSYSIPNIAFRLVAEGKVNIHEQPVTIQIALDNHFPHHKPLFFLKPYDALGLIPHVNRNGYICYTQDEGILLDASRPEVLLQECFQKALQLLIDGVEGNNQTDFMNEFETYFCDRDAVIMVNSIVELDETVKDISILIANHSDIFAGDNRDELKEYASRLIGSQRLKDAVDCTGLYIPLKPGTFIKPPDYNSFWRTKDIKQIIFENISEENLFTFNKLLKRPIDDPFIIIISIPLANKAKAVFGIRFNNFHLFKAGSKYIKNPLQDINSHYEITPLSINRMDKEYIYPRGGANTLYCNKRVALIGCGSLGSNIAKQLAQSGISYLTLIDNDFLSVENIYRHNCGFNRLINEPYKNNLEQAYYNPKIFALGHELTDAFPYIYINYHFGKIEDLLASDKLNFSTFDLIIVAIGNPTIELYLNEYFHHKANTTPVLFTWIEAYGIGGHAIVTNNNNQTGCLKCLYTEIDDYGNRMLQNKSSFAEQGAFFSKSLTGCGSLYMPYGSLDAIETSVLACRLALDVLSGKETDNPILSWKGNADTYLKEGYKLTAHYSLTYERLFDLRYSYKIKDCPICTKGA